MDFNLSLRGASRSAANDSSAQASESLGSPDRLGLTPNPAQQPAEDEAMEWHDRVPVGQPEQALGFEAGDLGEAGACVTGGARWKRPDDELERRLAGKLHLGPELETAVGFDRGHPPEVEGVAVADGRRMAAPASQPRPAGQPIEGTTQAPQEVGGVPAVTAPQPANGGEDDGRCRLDVGIRA